MKRNLITEKYSQLITEGLIFKEKIKVEPYELEAIINFYPKVKKAMNDYINEVKKAKPDSIDDVAFELRVEIESVISSSVRFVKTKNDLTKFKIILADNNDVLEKNADYKIAVFEFETKWQGGGRQI